MRAKRRNPRIPTNDCMPDKGLPTDVLRLIHSVVASMDHVDVLRHFVAAAGESMTVEE